MEIYIVIIEDRHTDTAVYPFTDKEKAVNEARRIAKQYCRHEDDYEEHDYGRNDGWLFYAQYSCESDNVRVVTATVDGEIEQ